MQSCSFHNVSVQSEIQSTQAADCNILSHMRLLISANVDSYQLNEPAVSSGTDCLDPYPPLCSYELNEPAVSSYQVVSVSIQIHHFTVYNKQSCLQAMY
jgi:hypothetical protein